MVSDVHVDGVDAIDFSALVEPAASGSPRTRADSAALRALLTRCAVAAMCFAIGAGMLVIFGAGFAEIAAVRGWQAGVPALLGGVLIAAVAGMLGAYILVVAWRLDVSRLGGAQRRARLQRFAEANEGISFAPELEAPPYPGIPFETARDPLVTDSIRIERGGRLVEVGNLVTTGMSGGRQVALAFGYVRILLPQRMPHLLAVSTADRGHSPIDVALDPAQRLPLEGDFDEHFALYVPRAFERDALYVLGPDLMARLIDQADEFDVEIVDSWLQIYAHRPFDPLAPETYERAIDLCDSVGSKVIRQVGRYSDDRAPTPDGGGGRRLRWVRGVMIASAVIGTAVGVLAAGLLR